jgi:cysteine desulfurase
MGLPLHVAMGAVRFSLSRYTTEAEVDRAVEIVAGAVPRVRQETAAAAQ